MEVKTNNKKKTRECRKHKTSINQGKGKRQARIDRSKEKKSTLSEATVRAMRSDSYFKTENLYDVT